MQPFSIISEVTSVFWLLCSILVVVLVTRVYLRGEDLTRFDRPVIEVVHRHVKAEAGRRETSELLQDVARQTAGLGWRARIAVVRQIMDDLGASHELGSERLPVHNELVSGEWILPADVSTSRRLLYVHGGAWVAGSPLSHRGIVERLAHAANAAVFVLNYRLMPENSRMDGIIDCRAAYEWLLVNGPRGAEPLEFFALAGDSAGGNLALATVAWARDEGLRLPDRVVALSPVTDTVMASPSLRRNELSDLMLGPYLGRLNRWPRPLLWWLS
jgi:monoterpene epsilon-lactone hydrolase